MGYYLTPGAAEKFIESLRPVFLSVDIYMDRYWSNKVLCCGVEPGFVYHDHQFESMIGYTEKRSVELLLSQSSGSCLLWVSGFNGMFTIENFG